MTKDVDLRLTYLTQAFDADRQCSVATPRPVLRPLLQGGHQPLAVPAVQSAGGIRSLRPHPEAVGALVGPVVEAGTLLVPETSWN